MSKTFGKLWALSGAILGIFEIKMVPICSKNTVLFGGHAQKKFKKSLNFPFKRLQVTQNRAARCVTGQPWFTPTRLLLKQCNWLSVRQLAHYHAVLLIHKTMMCGKPSFLYNKISGEKSRQTRQLVKFDDRFEGKSAMTQQSFCYRGTKIYNLLPVEIGMIQNVLTFKKAARK